MTICNMTIEGGGRAGMIAPDETTFDVVRGPPRGARRTSTPRSPAGASCAPTTARPSTREIVVDAAALSPQVTWGTNPGDGRRGHGTPSRSRARTATSARSSTWASRPARRSQEISSTASSSAPARTRGSATCAPPPRSSRAARSRRASTRWSSRAPQQVAIQAEAGGPRPGLPRRRLRLAQRRLLDVPRDEPRHPLAGRALRLDLQPQLRGPPGPRRAHPPRLARRWPPRPPSRGTSSTSGSGARWNP